MPFLSIATFAIISTALASDEKVLAIPGLPLCEAIGKPAAAATAAAAFTETLLFCSRRLIPACLVFGIHTVAVVQSRRKLS